MEWMHLVVEQFALQRLATIQFTHLIQLFTEPGVALFDSLHVTHNLRMNNTTTSNQYDQVSWRARVRTHHLTGTSFTNFKTP